MHTIRFEPLLQHLACCAAGRRLAHLSVQTKVEKFVLAEIASAGDENFPELEFWLEERRRDMTVRQRLANGLGPMVDWVEAKMCYSDCVARKLTRRGRVDEFCDLVARDVKKQDEAKLPDCDNAAKLTAMLFVFHRTEPHVRQVYYRGFVNRQTHSADEIMDEARKFCTNDIPDRIGRSVHEQFAVQLDDLTQLHSFVYRRPLVT